MVEIGLRTLSGRTLREERYPKGLRCNLVADYRPRGRGEVIVGQETMITIATKGYVARGLPHPLRWDALTWALHREAILGHQVNDLWLAMCCSGQKYTRYRILRVFPMGKEVLTTRHYPFHISSSVYGVGIDTRGQSRNRYS